MPEDTPADLPPHPIEAMRDVSHLAAHEVEHMLVQAERARLAEVDRYWALCKTNPEQAASLAAAAPILGDLFHLVRQRYYVPAPSTSPGLSTATERLLAVAAVRDALVEPVTEPGNPVDAFWEAGKVVALKIIGGRQVVVIQYDGPLFNPGTVPESEVRSEAYGYLACHRESIGDGGEFEYVDAYVFGTVAGDNHLTPCHLEAASRNDLIRDIPAMEALVEYGRISSRLFEASPLPAFPCASAALIARLRAHLATLRLRKTDHLHPYPDPRRE